MKLVQCTVHAVRNAACSTLPPRAPFSVAVQQQRQVRMRMHVSRKHACRHRSFALQFAHHNSDTCCTAAQVQGVLVYYMHGIYNMTVHVRMPCSIRAFWYHVTMSNVWLRQPWLPKQMKECHQSSHAQCSTTVVMIRVLFACPSTHAETVWR